MSEDGDADEVDDLWAEGAGVVGAGLVRRGISALVAVVVGDGVVEVDGAAGRGGPGPVVAAGDEVDLVAE